MTQSSVVVKSNLSSKWAGATAVELDVATLEMATDIHKRAVMLAPEDTGALVNSGVVERIKAAYYRIKFGSSQVPYARKRHFENQLHPNTLGYLAKAGDGVARGNTDKYLRKL